MAERGLSAVNYTLKPLLIIKSVLGSIVVSIPVYQQEPDCGSIPREAALTLLTQKSFYYYRREGRFGGGKTLENLAKDHKFAKVSPANFFHS